MKSDQDFQKQKKSLLDEKKRLEDEMKNLQKYPDKSSIGDDAVQEIVEFENNLSLEDKLNYLYKKVNKALRAIESGTYGRCTKCKASIERGRLDIMPYADVCVACAGKK